MRNRLTFDVEPEATTGRGGALVVTPKVDGSTLVDLVGGFEARRGYEPSGGYGGIVPSWFRLGDLKDYYLGRQAAQWPRPGHAWLLGCDCGEVGCWPLTARIIPLAETVTWTDFSQDHRPGWSYDGFGPFVFERSQYDTAVASMVEQLQTH